MNFSRFFITIPFLLFWTECQSPSDQIKQAFNKVDKSLEQSNAVTDNSIDGLYSAIKNSQKKNDSLAASADPIYLATKQACSYIDSIKSELLQQDSAGTQLTVAGKLLVSTRKGDKLRNELKDVYISAKSYSGSKTIEAEMDNSLQSLHVIQVNKDWAKMYFEQTPTVAAVTILSKLQNDCKSIAVIILADIKKRLIE